MATQKQAVKDQGDRLTVESLRYYVPIFQDADDSYESLITKLLDLPELKAKTEAAFALREFALDKLLKLAEPLIAKELNSILSKSHLRGTDESILNQLYYAGRAGAVKGLRHFDVDKLDASATNYLLQWFTAYAKKELLTIEAAPFGIPPSRFHTYKKISAVRKKLTELNGKYAVNQEVLDFFHSGAALELVEEQEYFERNLIVQNLIDPLDKSMSEMIFGETSTKLFSETLFGAFVQEQDLTDNAVLAIKYELQIDVTEEEQEALKQLSNSALRKLVSQWKLLIRDAKGPFYQFLLTARADGFDEFDIKRTLHAIDNGAEAIAKTQWESLFRNQETEK
jgi:hypothetical protein